MAGKPEPDRRLTVQPKYAWKPGASCNLDPQVVGEELDRLAGQSPGPIPHVTPESVVEAARPKDAPLHPALTWDDAKAAELHRLNEARTLVRAVRVEKDDSTVSKVPQFVSVRVQAIDSSAYVKTAVAMSDEEMRRQVLTDAMRQLRGWQTRYKHLTEFSGVTKAIDQVLQAG